MKKIYIILTYILSIYSTNAQNIPILNDNGDFESGITNILNTYSFRKGLNYNSSNCGNLNATWGQPYTYNYTIHNDLNSSVSLVSQGFDEVLLQYGISHPRVKSGRNAIRLNEKNENSGEERQREIVGIRKKYNGIKKYVSFDFSLIGEVHSTTYRENEEAFFSVRLITQTGQIIPLTCYITNTSNLLYNFINTGTGDIMYYTQWKKYNMAIPNDYVGQNLTLEIITSGCSAGAHYQILYLDNMKNTSESMYTPCNLQIDSIEYNTNTNNYELCGNFTTPSFGALYSINASATYNNEYIQFPNAVTEINAINNTYCIKIPSSDLQFSSPPNGTINFGVSSIYLDYFRMQSTYCEDSISIETSLCNVQILSNVFDSNLNSFIISGNYTTPNFGNLMYLNIYKDINGNLIPINVTNTDTNPNSFTFIIPMNELTPATTDIPLVVKATVNDVIRQKSTICNDTTIIEKKFLSNCDISIGFKDNSCDGSQLMYGHYTLPSGVTIQSLEVNIKDANNNTVFNNTYYPGLNQSNISNTNFSVLINTSNLNNLSNYTYRVSTNYIHTDGVTNQSCVIEFPQLFTQNHLNLSDFDYVLNSTNLSWTQFSESYLHQIVYDKSCVSTNQEPIQLTNPYTFSTNTNSISLAQLQQIAIANNISSTTVRWRIMLGCNEWSEWCCIQLPNSPYNIIGNCISDFTGAKNTLPYPNPTEGIITFQNNNYKFFEVINTKGNTVKKGNLDNTKEEITIDLSELNQDIYIIKFDNLESYKVIKN